MAGLIGAEFRGGEGLSLLFRRLEDQLQSERILDAAAALLLDRTRKRFLDEVDPDEVPWQESLSAQERETGGGTLFDTGSLFASINVFRKGCGVRSIAVDDAARNRLTGEPVAEYALIHQLGLEGQPKREFLGFSAADAVAVESLMIALLRRARR